ncbi:(2Fe-2S)-binding protein [Alicyclobacillus dauci]|uniref:(2Fe-2S)-binding protein n=1 Tax=Alicyclobacillus dauci TaxID=1475485 RepID=A0ABY6Z8Z7_9BACL|nr:(2Fe-2S)-binding protein [Alicyclobacillus dauci]WAH38729.1 (2Fe-2S)-binding protein [Alicyclobacillus dauci]
MAEKREAILDVNGEKRSVVIRPADPLLDVLRTNLGLSGAKPGCENGDCGACTILMNGIPHKSCLMLAIECVGQSLTTIEGLRDIPIQKAFVECFAFQCGYCTPGFIMNAHAMLSQRGKLDDSTIQMWLESNICRCTSYEEIEHAVRLVNHFLHEDG